MMCIIQIIYFSICFVEVLFVCWGFVYNFNIWGEKIFLGLFLWFLYKILLSKVKVKKKKKIVCQNCSYVHVLQ